MHVAFSVTAVLLATVVSFGGAHAQQAEGGGAKTFRAELYRVSGASDASGLTVEHLPDATPEVGVLLEGKSPEKLQALTVAPGQDNAVVKYNDLTFRISGLYRGPQKDRMFLRVSFDQGGQAVVKEFLAGLNEAIVVRYPLAGQAGGAVVVLLVPTS